MAVAWNGATLAWSAPGALPGITLDGQTPDSNGCVWLVEDYKGWDGTPPPRPLRTDRPFSSGAYRGPDYLSSRIVSLTGTIWCPTPAVRAATARQLAAAFTDPNTLYALTRTAELGAETLYVELDAEAQIDVLTTPDPGTVLSFSLQLAAPDPRKYSATSSSGQTNLPSTTGGLDWQSASGLVWTNGLNWGTFVSTGQFLLTNSGTAPSWPTFVVSANGNTLNAPGITISINNSVLQYTGTLSPLDVLTIVTDPAKRSVTIGGADRRVFLTTAQWAPVPGNSSAVISFSASNYTSTAVLQGSLFPAFW